MNVHKAHNRITIFPKYDIGFKSLFKSEESGIVTEGFLRAMLDFPEGESLGEFHVKDPELLPQIEEGKLSVLDVLIEMPSGEKILVEMQKNRFPGMKERLVYEWAHVALRQLSRGRKYKEFRRVIFVALMENNIIEDSPHYIHRYELYDKKWGSRFTDVISFVIIDYPNKNKIQTSLKTQCRPTF